jgi:hypothetical protein
VSFFRRLGEAPRALATLCGMRAHTAGLGQAFDDLIAAAIRGLAQRWPTCLANRTDGFYR